MAVSGTSWRDEIYPSVEDEAVFLGEAFRKYLLRQARRCCDKTGIRLRVGAFPKMPNAGGWTDGNEIVINAACAMVATYPKTELKVLGMIGTAAHECGHINYTDMEKRRMYGEGIENGILYPEMPQAAGEREEAVLKELQECLMKKEKKQLIVIGNTLLMLHNILEDIYIEARQCARFGGIVQKAIRFDSRWSTERAATIRQMQDAGIGELEIMQNVILYYLRTGKVNDWENAGKKYREILEDCKGVLENAVKSCDPDDRFRASNRLLLFLWPFVREAFEQEEPEKKRMPEYEGKTSGNAWEKKEIPEAFEAEQEKLEKALRRIRATKRIGGATELTKTLKKIWSSAAGEQAKKAAIVRKKVSSERSTEAQTAGEEMGRAGVKPFRGQAVVLDLADIHRGHKIYLNREEPEAEDMLRYESAKKEVTETVEGMIRRIRPLLAEQDAGWERGLIQGKRISQKGLSRMDGRIFGRRNVPGERRPVAVTVLLDESGSMLCDGKIEAAGQTALVLYHFCRQLQIPVRILGHSTGRHGAELESVELYCYTAFEPGDAKEGGRLMRIRERDCNRDGAALAYAGEELAKRPEETKLLFVVTDGCPYGECYMGEAAVRDTQEVKKKLVRKGIHVIAAAIGDDREEIESIYGKGFLNISDLKRLPGALAALIGTYLERQV